MINKHLKKTYFLLFLIFTACGGGNKFDVDLSETSVTVDFIDWIPSLESKDAEKCLAKLKSGSGELYKYYLGRMIGADPEIDTQCIKMLDMFMYFPSTVEGIKEIKTVYKDFTPYLQELKTAFGYINYHFPERKKFKIVTYHSGFNYGIFPVDNEIGIGLDMYLGSKNKITQALPNEKFPQYIKNNMTPENLVVDALRGYTMINLVPENSGDDLVSAMVAEGKILYALDAFMPKSENYQKIRYTKAQLDWCEEYEARIWKEIVDHAWLYSKDVKVISQFVNEAPFTGTLPQDSPPRAGAWVGWQIVRAYANDNPDLSLKVILEEPDVRKILRSYKPPK